MHDALAISTAIIAVAEEVHMKTIELVHQSGQSMWLDFISRSLIRSGQLKRMVEQGGLTGVSERHRPVRESPGVLPPLDE